MERFHVSIYRISVFCSLLLALQGCVTAPKTYSGPGPDWQVKGDAARAEFNKFRFNEGSWADFEMGPEKTAYTQESILPLIREVSPEAGRRLKRNESVGVVWTASVYTIIATSLGVLLTSHDKKTQKVLSIANTVAFAGFLVTPFIMGANNRSAIKTYNRDLRDRLLPGLQVSWRY